MSEQLEAVRTQLARSGATNITPANVAGAMRSCGQVVTDRTVIEAITWLKRTSFGAGVLEELLRLPGVTDVLVNGPRQVYFDRGAGLEQSEIKFEDDAQVRALAARLAAAAGERLDDSSPFVDGRLADGTRLHAVLSPVSQPGTAISLRVPAKRGFSLVDLVSAGSVPPAGARLLSQMIERRLAFLVSGGTGSGKSTLLAALLGLVDGGQRIVLVEDSRELQLAHDHWVALSSRGANTEGAGAISMAQLLRQALRMRPDRVVIGEVRGAELKDLLLALNTGHEGGCATIHANSVQDLPARLEALAALGGLDRAACQAQVISALHAAIHIGRDANGRRRVESVGVFVRDGAGVRVVPAVRFERDQVTPGAGLARLEELLR